MFNIYDLLVILLVTATIKGDFGRILKKKKRRINLLNKGFPPFLCYSYFPFFIFGKEEVTGSNPVISSKNDKI